MGIEFDWQVTEEDDDPSEQAQRPSPPWMRWSLMLFVLLLLGGVAGGLYWRLDSAESDLIAKVQALVDLQHQTFTQRDGELFFATFDLNDNGLHYQQLQPDFQNRHRHAQTVTNAEQTGNIIWANLTQQIEGVTTQRIAFFEETDLGLRELASDPAYWGPPLETGHAWGLLYTHEADAQWSQLLADTVAASIAPTTTERVSVFVRPNFDVSVRPNTIYVPSPRLVGLDANGMPTDAYLTHVQQAVQARLEPVAIRFAVPEFALADGVAATLARYASDFNNEVVNQDIQVEIVPREALAGRLPEEWLPEVDGALFRPTEALIKRGHIYDLTQLVSDDVAFNRSDFYIQAWRSAWWEDRMWTVPWSMRFNLLYFNLDMFEASGAALPEASWTWEQLQSVLQELTLQDAADRPVIDPTRDLLYAYAYSIAPACEGQECLTSLNSETVLETLRWYRDLVGEEAIFTDLASLTTIERAETTMGTLSVHKQVASWVDSPTRYEYQITLQKTAVLPFLDFSAETPLIAPAHVHGHIISAHSDQAYWTWQWIKYLSFRTTPAGLRHIPARPSVMRQDAVLQNLPAPITSAYQTIFGSASPILIGEESYFTWSQLTQAANAQSLTPNLATPPATDWFLP